MTYKQFVKMKCSDKNGSLSKLSKLKKESPDEYNAYSAEFDFAFDRIIRANNMQCAKRDGYKLITEKTILENSTVKYPDKDFSELRDSRK